MDHIGREPRPASEGVSRRQEARVPPSRARMWTIFMEIIAVKRRIILHARYFFAHIDRDRCTYIGEPFAGHPRLDAGARGSVGIARQPDELGQRLGEADDMLSSTRPNFKHDALLRQNASQDLSDRQAIARGRRGELSRILYRNGAQAMVGVWHVDKLSNTTVCVWPRPTKGETLAARSAAPW